MDPENQVRCFLSIRADVYSARALTEVDRDDG